MVYLSAKICRPWVSNLFADLQISAEDHLYNMINLGKFLVKTTFKTLGKSWKSDSWTTSFAQVVKVFNAFYVPYNNQFVLPAGYLHHFNFNSDQPMYLNYAITGATIGHEMIHGFDSQGRDWDKNGNGVKSVQYAYHNYRFCNFVDGLQ